MSSELTTIFAFAGGMVIVFAVTKIALAWIHRPRVPRSERADLNARLDRLEQIMESTALEVERIGEGQRFLTNQLTNGRLPAAAERLPSPVTTPH